MNTISKQFNLISREIDPLLDDEQSNAVELILKEREAIILSTLEAKQVAIFRHTCDCSTENVSWGIDDFISGGSPICDKCGLDLDHVKTITILK